MNKKNILVFPCGSEIGLEIHRSLKYSRHINLIGCSSIQDHGKYVYENYISEIPFITEDEFIPILKNIIHKYDIDAIYPAMDSVISKISDFKEELGCKIIGSVSKSNKICLSKKKTYKVLEGSISIPKIYNSIDEVLNFPVFIKPNVGYGSRGARLIKSYS